MASLKSNMHVLLPLSIVLFLSLQHIIVVAGHRKLHIKKLPIKRLLMSSSSPTFYNAFDATNSINTNNPLNHNNFYHHNAGSNFNYEGNANVFPDIVDSEFNTNSYTNSHPNNANLPVGTTNTHKADGVQYSYPTTYDFSSPSFSSTPSGSFGGKFPASFEASLPDVQNSYGKQSFPSNEQQGLYRTSVDASPSREQSLFKSPSSYEASYDPFHASVNNKPEVNAFDELQNKKHVSNYEFKNEKPVSNYDSFFNSPTIHKSEVEGSTPFGRPTFPLSDHDLTYGHVQVP